MESIAPWPAAADLHDRARRSELATQIAQRHRALATRERNARRAGDLADVLVAFGDLGAGLRRFAVEQKSCERSMQDGTGANALHDFLPDVASLGEIERVLLLSLLRQFFAG